MKIVMYQYAKRGYRLRGDGRRRADHRSELCLREPALAVMKEPVTGPWRRLSSPTTASRSWRVASVSWGGARRGLDAAMGNRCPDLGGFRQAVRL